MKKLKPLFLVTNINHFRGQERRPILVSPFVTCHPHMVKYQDNELLWWFRERHSSGLWSLLTTIVWNPSCFLRITPASLIDKCWAQLALSGSISERGFHCSCEKRVFYNVISKTVEFSGIISELYRSILLLPCVAPSTAQVCVGSTPALVRGWEEDLRELTRTFMLSS